MGDFQTPLQHLRYFSSVPPVARVMTKLPNWAPKLRNGREFQTKTVLGPALGVTSLPDVDWHFGRMINMPQPQPNVALTLFRNPDTRSAEVRDIPALCHRKTLSRPRSNESAWRNLS